MERKTMSGLIFHFLNVGKGNCTIIDFPSNRLTVVDIDDSRSIPSSEKAFMEIVEKKAKLTNPIDYIVTCFEDRDIFRFILTHPDMDHMSGIKDLFEKKSVLNFWDTDNEKYIDPDSWDNSPYDKEDWEFYQNIRNSTENPNSLKIYRDAVSECCWTQDGIEILAPTKELVEIANAKEEYDHLSYVLRVNYAGKKVLLGGDATKAVWEDIIECYGESYIKSDVFLAPNHGSLNHITNEILEAINPDLTVVSVAEGIDYGYNLYRNYGIVLSTKHFGNILVAISENGDIYFLTQVGIYSDRWYKLPSRTALPLSGLLGSL